MIQLPLIQANIKLLLILIGLSALFSYLLFSATKGRFALFGDFYKVKGGHRIYIPLGSSLIISILLYIVLTTKLIYYVVVLFTMYLIYRLIFHKKIF